MLTSKLSFTEFFNSTWLKVPQVWRDADRDNGKPLQLIVLTICQHMYYYFYEKIVNMDELFDVDKCPKEYLKFLASILGWELIGQDPDSWRNQIRACPLLYKLRGNKRGLMLAEKLVGYSVFMSELYRDYSGNLSTKERIFGSFPISLRMKSWFRKRALPDISDIIASDVDSDAFQSYNKSSGAILTATGNIFYPKFLKQVSSRRLSTIKPYNAITGVRSDARLAKTTRYNFVLKKDTDLDFINPFTGKMTEVNIDGAIKLLLQFKPFHIYIQDLVVMVSLSDYLSLLNKPIDIEHLLFTDYDETSIGIFDEEKEKFFNQAEFISPCSLPLSSTEEFFNKGSMELKHITLLTNERVLITSVNTISNVGLPLNGLIRKTIVGKPDELWHISDFGYNTDRDIYSQTYNQSVLFDLETGHTSRAVDLGININFGFYSIPLTRNFEIIDLKQFFSTRKQVTSFTSNEILSISYSPSNYYSGKVVLKVTGDNFKTLTQTFI